MEVEDNESFEREYDDFYMSYIVVYWEWMDYSVYKGENLLEVLFVFYGRRFID